MSIAEPPPQSAKAICAQLAAQLASKRGLSPFVRVPGSPALAEALRTLYDCAGSLAALNPLANKSRAVRGSGADADASTQLALELRVAQRVTYIAKNQQRHMRHFHKLREARRRISQMFECCPPAKVLEPFAEAAVVARNAALSAKRAAAPGSNNNDGKEQQQQQRGFDDETVGAVAALRNIRVPASSDCAAALEQLRSLEQLALVAERACEDVVVSTDSELVAQKFFLGLSVVSETTAARLAAYARYCRSLIQRACASLAVLQREQEQIIPHEPEKDAKKPAPRTTASVVAQSVKAALKTGKKAAKKGKESTAGAGEMKAKARPVSSTSSSSDVAGKMALLMRGIKKPRKRTQPAVE